MAQNLQKPNSGWKMYLPLPCIYGDLIKTYHVTMQQYNRHRHIGNKSVSLYDSL